MLQENQEFSTLFKRYLIENGMAEGSAHLLNLGLNLLVLGLLLLVLHLFARRVIIRIFNAFSVKTSTTFDDSLMQSKFPNYAGNLLPLLLLIFSIPTVFAGYPTFANGLRIVADIYLIILSILICRSLLRSSKNYLKTLERFRDKPLDSFMQVFMIFVWAVGLVFIFSELTGRSVLGFLISLGAASAVILLIFKDTILGFVASIQVSVNDIVRIGDWITFSKYGADGYVTEINLATVRVQNWDKTYTTIPTYSLIADSFHNWRGMEESPGRRIKRSLFIKQNSIRFVTAEDLQKFERFSIIAPYLRERQKEIDEFNQTHDFDRETVLNGRNQTNLGIFRKYADAYLRAHPLVNQDLTLMVRQLEPTTEGIPLEIYCFSNDKRWTHYEQIIADIFDHLIAAIPYFDLKLFESPSGDDLIKISEHLAAGRE